MVGYIDKQSVRMYKSQEFMVTDQPESVLFLVTGVRVTVCY